MSTENQAQQTSTTTIQLIVAVAVLAPSAYYGWMYGSILPIAIPVGIGALIFFGSRRDTRRATENWAPLAAELKSRMPNARITSALELAVDCNGTQVAVKYLAGSREPIIQISATPQCRLTDFHIAPTAMLQKPAKQSIDFESVYEFDRHFTVDGKGTQVLRALWTPQRQQAYLDIVCSDPKSQKMVIAFKDGTLTFIRIGDSEAESVQRVIELMAELAGPDALPKSAHPVASLGQGPRLDAAQFNSHPD